MRGRPELFNPADYPRLTRLGWRFGHRNTEITIPRELGERLIAAGYAKRLER